ncbi:DNA cytosine methyltransferase [Pseudofulvibacter geojedonensis]|uniref:DNA (cytosine-5-)-methyltransferase n=1 Tax=Pseudofulvibacter geojedonensis TaxID=1123758 RepID=A0ABW3I3C8_9FLAO
MNINNGINVLSLFDGISVAQLAFTQLEIKINNYFASEIDNNPIKVTQHHFPGTIQLGDVCEVDGTKLPEIDLLIFGSPCQDLSSMKKDRTGLTGEKSGLFFEALRILKEVNPKYFLMENVGSMSKYDRKVISDLLGVKPIHINSNLLTGQNRNRIYWTNIPNLTKPNDSKIQLKNIIEDGYVDRKKSNAILTKNVPYTKNGLIRYLKKSLGGVVFTDSEFATLTKKQKLAYIEPLNDEQVRKLYRPFTSVELERLQSLPDGYVSEVLKKTPTHHAIGNSFTTNVIQHILSHAEF